MEPYGAGGPSATGDGPILKNIALVDVDIVGRHFAGALTGYIWGDGGSIENSYATGRVTGNNYLGGLAGATVVPIIDSYAHVDIKGGAYVGGLVGELFADINNSYSTGHVSSNQTSFVGGLVGAISGEYKVSASYWDTESSRQPSSPGGTGKTTSELYKQATFEGWDFVNTWKINEEAEYPSLRFLKEIENPSPGEEGGWPDNGSESTNTDTSGNTDTSENTVVYAPGQGGTSSFMNGDIKITVPKGASLQELRLQVQQVLNLKELISNKDVLLSPVFEISKNFPGNFRKSVTLTFTFDSNKLRENQTVAVFYYDEDKKVWVKVGGVTNGDTISVDIDHFTKFAVFAIDKEEKPETKITFTDIHGHWAETSIKQAVEKDFVNGYPNGTFRPDGAITRAEFIVMLTRALNLQGDEAQLMFTDNASILPWARKAVAQAVQAGIVVGYLDGQFRPDKKIERSEMAMMLANALHLTGDTAASTDFADDADIPAWAKAAVVAIAKEGIIKGRSNNRFAPNENATRAEAVTILVRLLEKIK